MMPRLALLCTFFLLSTFTFAQISTPEKRPFNIGIFSGIGGVNFTPIPALDLHYKGTLLRVAPGYRANAVGILREIMPLSEVFYNWKWIASIYGAKGEEEGVHASKANLLTTTFYKGSVMTGVKVYFSRRWYSQLQGGVSYTQYKTPGYPTDKEYSPYFEFNLGINIFKTYKNEEDFE